MSFVSGKFTVCAAGCGSTALTTTRETWDAIDRIFTGTQRCDGCQAQMLYSRRATREEQDSMAKRKTTAKAAKSGSNGTGRKKGPRSQVLPGLEQVRSKPLDNLCEGIAEARGQMNTAKQEESGLIQLALQTMVKRGVSVYRHVGVELSRIPGAEKLRVRLTKEQGDAGAEDLDQPEPEPEADTAEYEDA